MEWGGPASLACVLWHLLGTALVSCVPDQCPQVPKQRQSRSAGISILVFYWTVGSQPVPLGSVAPPAFKVCAMVCRCLGKKVASLMASRILLLCSRLIFRCLCSLAVCPWTPALSRH